VGRLSKRATSARNFAGAMAPDSSPRRIGRIEFADEGQNDQARIEANRFVPPSNQ
jgi:hypothetical protein